MSARQIALKCLREWRAGREFADSILQRNLDACALRSPDRAFATELFYGVLRNLTLLDFWIAQLREGKIESASRDILRLGFYQLLLLDTPEHAGVYETVELGAQRTRAFLNGILREAIRRKTALLEKTDGQPLSVQTSHPNFLIERWQKHFGKDATRDLCAWNNKPAPVYLRINELKISGKEFLQKYPGTTPLTDQSNFVKASALLHDALARGECYAQDASTAVACALLDPKPGEKILDACAAPGGKTGYVAQLAQNAALMVACDRDERRLTQLRGNLKRLGVENVKTLKHDWERDRDIAAVGAAGSFERILLDAPCSNTGVMRRRVDVRWRLTLRDFSRMSMKQFSILSALIPLLKPGGTLVYSTCSLEPEENAGVVVQALRKFPECEVIEQKQLLPFRDGVDGAFAAKIIRNANARLRA